MDKRAGFLNGLALAVACFLGFGVAISPAWAQTIINATWNDGTGNWTTASDWNCPSSGMPCIPNNGSPASYDVTINGTFGGVIVDNTSTPSTIMVNALSLAGGYTTSLDIQNGGSLSTTGNVTNDTRLDLSNSPGIPCSISGTCYLPTTLSVGADLKNGGTIVLGNEGEGGTITLSLAGNLTNSGTLSLWNYSSAGSRLDVGGNLANSGTLEVGSSLADAANVSNSGNVDVVPLAGSPLPSSLTVSKGGSYTQTAGLTGVDGTLMAPTVRINSGMLYGNGVVSGNVTNDGTVSPGDPNATLPNTALAINGNYTQGSDGTLVINVSSATDFSILDVIGKASLDGIVDFDFLNGYVPGANVDFGFLKAGSAMGDFTGLHFINLNCPTCTFNLSTLSLNTGSTPPTSPEPGTLLLLTTGLFALAYLMRKKQGSMRRAS